MKLLQVAISLDQFVNTLFGGHADETLSSRAWRCKNKSKRWFYAWKFIDFLFFWQDNHCKRAYMSEQLRKHLPNDFNNLV